MPNHSWRTFITFRFVEGNGGLEKNGSKNLPLLHGGEKIVVMNPMVERVRNTITY